MALALLSETWLPRSREASRRSARRSERRTVERQTPLSGAASRTARDRRPRLDDRRSPAAARLGRRARAYCDEPRPSAIAIRLAAADDGRAARHLRSGRGDWRRGLKLKAPFRAGVTSPATSGATSATTADATGACRRLQRRDVRAAAGRVRRRRARAVRHVAAADGRAEGLASKRAGVLDVLRAIRAARRLRARLPRAGLGRQSGSIAGWRCRRILERFVAAGGRNPDAGRGEERRASDAPTAHHTIYASTGRRVVGYAHRPGDPPRLSPSSSSSSW